MEQTELDKEIGTKEPEKETLEPKKVKIVDVVFRDTAKGKILTCVSQHPDREEPIKISSISHLRDRKVVTSGLWFTEDEDKNIQKGSALSIFLHQNGCKSPRNLIGKEVETELDDKKWLCFRAY